MKKIYNIVVATSSYTTASGRKQSTWDTIGSVFENDDGKKFILLKAHVNLSALPRKDGSECVMCYLFDSNQNGNSQPANNNRPAAYKGSFYNLDNDFLDTPDEFTKGAN